MVTEVNVYDKKITIIIVVEPHPPMTFRGPHYIYVKLENF